MPNIHVPQKNKTFTVAEGTSLMFFLLENKIPVASSCKGDGICGKCYLKIKYSNKFEPFELAENHELEVILKNKLNPNNARLSCQVQVYEDIEVSSTYW